MKKILSLIAVMAFIYVIPAEPVVAETIVAEAAVTSPIEVRPMHLCMWFPIVCL